MKKEEDVKTTKKNRKWCKLSSASGTACCHCNGGYFGSNGASGIIFMD